SFSNATDQDFLEKCIELVTLNNDHLLESYVNGEEVTEEQLKMAVMNQTRDAKIYPIFFGSAITGIGVAELLAGVAAMFPANNIVLTKKRHEHEWQLRTIFSSTAIRDKINWELQPVLSALQEYQT